MPNEGEQWAELPGRLVVMSGPAGSGKSTLAKCLLERPDLKLRRSISATTRAPRAGEEANRDYFFVSHQEFERVRGDLLEYAQVHGHYYGTPRQTVREAMAAGDCVLLVIDVQGGFQVRQIVPGALLIFIQPPTPAVLEDRLRGRGTEDTATIERRLETARRELELASLYDVHVINDDLDRAVEELASILKENGCAFKEKP
jgi:guanylate kinase